MSKVRILSPRPEIINHFYLVFIKPLVKKTGVFFAKSVFCGAKNKLAKDDPKMRKAGVETSNSAGTTRDKKSCGYPRL